MRGARWFGPLFWPYAHYDVFDYVYWPYAYDDFWPYAYDDVYYGNYGPYAYSHPTLTAPMPVRTDTIPGGARAAAWTRVVTRRGRIKRTGALRKFVAMTPPAKLTDWPIERISEVVQPTDAQRPALDELRAANAGRSTCPRPVLQRSGSIPTGRLAAHGEPSTRSCSRPCRPCVRPWSASTESLSDRAKSALQRHRDLRNVDARRCQAAGPDSYQKLTGTPTAVAGCVRW